MKFFVVFTVLVICGGCATVRPSVMMNRAYEDELGDAKKLVQSGQLRQAVDELTMLLDMDPANVEARFLRAGTYQRLEEFPSAIKDYEALLKKTDVAFKAHYNLGMIYAFKLGDVKKALEHFDSYLTLDPHGEKAFSVAKVMCSLDASRQGSQESIDDKSLPGLLSEAMAIRDPGEKGKKMTQIAERNPGSPVPHYLLGKNFEELGKRDEAIREYESALEIRPTCAPCHEALGQALISEKKEEPGRDHLLKAKLFDPNHTQSGDPI